MIILVGPPGCGGDEICAHIGGVSTDSYIAEQHGMPLDELFDQGADVAQIQEESALAVLDTEEIVLLGSGVLGNHEGDERGAAVRERVSELVAHGATKIWLDAEPKALLARSGLDVPRSVGLGAPRAMFLSQYKKRVPLYSADAVRIDTTDFDVADIGERILAIGAVK